MMYILLLELLLRYVKGPDVKASIAVQEGNFNGYPRPHLTFSSFLNVLFICRVLKNYRNNVTKHNYQGYHDLYHE